MLLSRLPVRVKAWFVILAWLSLFWWTGHLGIPHSRLALVAGVGFLVVLPLLLALMRLGDYWRNVLSLFLSSALTLVCIPLVALGVLGEMPDGCLP